jgi:hypothetical protein
MGAKENFWLDFRYFFVRGISKIEWLFDGLSWLHGSTCLTSHGILNYWLNWTFVFAMFYLTEFADIMASFRSGVLAPGCICFLYLMHFKISEISNKNLAHPSSRAMLCRKSFTENWLAAYPEKIKFGGKIYKRAKIVEMYTLNFFGIPFKMCLLV